MAMSLLRVLTGVVIGALVSLMLFAGSPKEPWWWLLALLLGAWIIGPAIMPYLAARLRADQHWFVWTMLTFQTLSSAWAASVYYEAFFISTSSTAALVMLFVPFYQWAALGCVVLVCACTKVWLKRRRN